jgi:hypothetical protein
MKEYVNEYPMSGAYGKFALISRSNFQLYPPSGGYKTFHTERTGAREPEGSRHLVFMTSVPVPAPALAPAPAPDLTFGVSFPAKLHL